MNCENKDSIYHIFLKTMKTHNARIQALFDGMDFHHGQFHLLFILNQKDGKIQKELSEMLNVKPSTTTVMIKRMEKNSLIVKKIDEKDQRVSRIYITEKGRKTCLKAEKIFRDFEEENFGNFTEEERESFKTCLLKLKNNIEVNLE